MKVKDRLWGAVCEFSGKVAMGFFRSDDLLAAFQVDPVAARMYDQLDEDLDQ